ncbi:MAG: acylneuraminate cytidylyltransferase family protein, partial [Proteobacteria bacterium]|nr:acylneuraminate cytidylyltransferase family protein [Pseudomonadota bacterium]
PARGGSKSVPLKNIKKLCGKPLLAYAIESAVQSKSINRLIVSTNHDQIAKVTRECGTEVIMRPAELATDEAPTEWALLHAIDEL